ncbi:MAG: hypothetical protein CXZ00_03100 [Acidobacteria bacterium]|nr:MAG: hypothetical protein CXZ00_03100 [Acidobacteriota bacterium]
MCGKREKSVQITGLERRFQAKYVSIFPSALYRFYRALFQNFDLLCSWKSITDEMLFVDVRTVERMFWTYNLWML